MGSSDEYERIVRLSVGKAFRSTSVHRASRHVPSVIDPENARVTDDKTFRQSRTLWGAMRERTANRPLVHILGALMFAGGAAYLLYGGNGAGEGAAPSSGAIVLIIALSFSLLICAAQLSRVSRTMLEPLSQIARATAHCVEGNPVPIPSVGATPMLQRLAGDIATLSQRASDTAAGHDVLTGLPLREGLLRHINRSMAHPDGNRSFGILHIDIDRFGEINDSLGRSAGDSVLRDFARVVRPMIGPDECLSRDGPDSFVMHISRIRSDADLVNLAKHLQAEAQRQIKINGSALGLTCCIGIARGRPDVPTDMTVVNAEDATREARRAGRGSIQVYTDDLDNVLNARRSILHGLRFALENGEIEPYFQPQVSATSGEIVGFEALARWVHPEEGVLSPWQFLPIAEEAGLLCDISDVMIDRSLKQLSAWRRAGLAVPRISLNMTGRDLSAEDFTDRLMLQIDRHGLAPGDVCIEILESAMIEQSDDPITATLNRLNALGFPIELDDFGTVHAAISSLQLIDLSAIKIDRSFVTDVHKRPERRKLINAIIKLARGLEIGSVAEGVECDDERAVLQELGCQCLQGYGIARPMSGADATRWLMSYKPGGRMVPMVAAV